MTPCPFPASRPSPQSFLRITAVRNSRRYGTQKDENESDRGTPMNTYRNLPILAVLAVATGIAQQNPVLGEDTVKVSDHVWAIMGFPNIAIVVGSRATLVVDTGMGPRNGAVVAKATQKLSRYQRLYL